MTCPALQHIMALSHSAGSAACLHAGAHMLVSLLGHVSVNHLTEDTTSLKCSSMCLQCTS